MFNAPGLMGARVQHTDDVVKTGVIVRDTAEHGPLAVSQASQVQGVPVGDPGNFREVEGGQPHGGGN